MGPLPSHDLPGSVRFMDLLTIDQPQADPKSHTPIFYGLIITGGFDPDHTLVLPGNPTIDSMGKRMRSKTKRFTEKVLAALAAGEDPAKVEWGNGESDA